VEELMEVLHERCCGLDVRKETVVACLRIVVNGKVVKEARTLSTTTTDLMNLSAWLAQNKCTHVAMEATGVYWKPVWHILSDGDFERVLANAAHVKNVPGRKTDVKDADWVSDLLAHSPTGPASCQMAQPRRCAPAHAQAVKPQESEPHLADTKGAGRR